MTVEERIMELDLEIPPPVKPLGVYLPAVLSGNQIYISGQLPLIDGKLIHKGILGKEISIDQGYEAARICTLNSLSAIKNITGNLDKIKRIVKLNGYVSSDKDFYDQPKVINGASELLFHAFGERGRHARSAIGVRCLPLGSCVEIDMVVEI